MVHKVVACRTEDEHLHMVLPLVGEPIKKQLADSIKLQKDAHSSVRRYDPDLDKQHKQSLLRSASTHLGKLPKKKEFAKGYPYENYS